MAGMMPFGFDDFEDDFEVPPETEESRFRGSRRGYTFEAGGRRWRVIRDDIGYQKRLVVDATGRDDATAFWAELTGNIIKVSPLSKHGEYRPVGRPLAIRKLGGHMIDRVAARYLQRRQAGGEEVGVEIFTEPRKGWAVVVNSNGASMQDLIRELNRFMVRRLTGATVNVPRYKGAIKAFSFHWSNAAAAWDVVPWRLSEFPHTMQDGSEFTLFVMSDGVSPVGKPWSLTEMRYVAKGLDPHPGFAGSVEYGARR